MVKCPYCEKENEVNHDDGYGYEEDYAYEQGCSFCEKTFVYFTSISYYHEGRKAPCKNGGDHNLEEIHGHPKEFFKYKRRCKYCDEEFIIDEEAHEKEMKEYWKNINNNTE